MSSPIQLFQSTAPSQIAEFFRLSVGQWRSERRYYMLPDGEIQEFVSSIAIRFLEAGSPELLQLAKLHHLSEESLFACGTHVTWQSTRAASAGKPSEGSTIFGVLGNLLLRDRGFATAKPVTAHYYMPNPHTLCLRTEYNDSVFEEEIKHIGHNYRTRQTIISRAGEHVTIGQYLEKRIQ